MPGGSSMNEVMDDDFPLRVWDYVDQIPENRPFRLWDAIEAYMADTRLNESVIHIPPPPPPPQPPTTRTSGLGLSEEKISEHLRVMKRNVVGKCEGEEVDSCSICLCEYEENEMVGIVECGHQFHGECIKGWLLSKNVCPLCRATALTV